MSILQQDLLIEGALQTNSAIEALNTKIFQDTGAADAITIEIKGVKNRTPDLPIIENYNQLLNIPIHIIKNMDTGNNTELFLSVNGLGEKLCAINPNTGLKTDIPKNLLRAGDLFTARYNGTYFILTGANIEALSNGIQRPLKIDCGDLREIDNNDDDSNENPIPSKIQLLHGEADQMPSLNDGETYYATDLNQLFIGSDGENISIDII